MDLNSHPDDLTATLAPFRSLVLLVQQGFQPIAARRGKVLTYGNESSAAAAAHISGTRRRLQEQLKV